MKLNWIFELGFHRFAIYFSIRVETFDLYQLDKVNKASKYEKKLILLISN